MFYTYLQEVCKKNGKTVTGIAKELNVSTSNVTTWKNGTIPKGETIIRICELLNVSADYLLFGKEDISKEEKELLQLLKPLSPEEKQQVIGMIKVLIFQDKIAVNVDVQSEEQASKSS